MKAVAAADGLSTLLRSLAASWKIQCLFSCEEKCLSKQELLGFNFVFSLLDVSGQAAKGLKPHWGFL